MTEPIRITITDVQEAVRRMVADQIDSLSQRRRDEVARNLGRAFRSAKRVDRSRALYAWAFGS